MASSVRSVDFLPEIFQTPVNKQFLSATLDQLIQEPQYKQTQGYIGQKVGPGVVPTDNYVVEPTASRENYQLEPGVISLDPATLKISDAITYPGILDAISTQGGYTNQADRLFESEYYSWDPFVNFDKFNNYSQYYWLPNGPDAVTVSATSIPSTQTFNVTRANGAYTISGYAGTNPTISLLRNGQYQFNIAQNNTNAIDYRVQNNGTSSWNIDYVANPTLTLVRGNTYSWNLIQTLPLAFYIKTAETYGTTNLWTQGVTNNGATTGIVTFTVPQNAPDTLYYVNDTEFNLRGQITVVDAEPGDGPGFWIQSAPGIDGVLPWSHNISSRDVLGVTNNGTDLGIVNFNVPDATAQNFYTSMPSVGYVNLVANDNLKFNQLNGISVAQFNETFPQGIDGITNINGRSIIFTNNITDPVSGGWEIETPFDPLPSNSTIPNPPAIGGFDTITYDQSTPITDPAVQFGIWQIQYVTINGTQYIQLTPLQPVAALSQFTINYGTQYVNTQWYKNTAGYFQQMPLLTATATNLYYQDGQDPAIFGVFNLIDQALNSTIDIDADILGQKNYTSPNGVTFTNGLKVVFQGNVIPESYQGTSYYVYGVGESIVLLPITNFITPEPFVTTLTTPYDSAPYGYGPYNAAQGNPTGTDYVTISMAAQDLNPWTRGNRWFHTDVIKAAAAYNNTAPNYTGLQRAKRPILEFRAGLKLFNFCSEGIPPVDVIDFTQTDALLNVNGKSGYGTDGYQLSQGSYIVFAADNSPSVRNQVYYVEFVVLDPAVSTIPVINLTPTSYSPVLPNQGTVCLSGLTQEGQSYYYDGTTWILAQNKESTNQAPLFDVYNSSGYSFGDATQYPSTNFSGCKLLSYAEDSTNTVDPVLEIPLAFFSIDNIGDILFDNNLYIDTFVYTPSGVGMTVNVSSGFVRQYSARTTFELQLGWQTVAIPSLPRQQFQFTYADAPLQLDILAETNLNVPAVQIFVNSVYQLPSSYTLSVDANTNTTIITLNGFGITTGDIVEVLAYSQQVSNVGFYQIPVNLENNPFNGNSKQFSLGTVRSHYATICENLVDFDGVINGPNNTRDLGNIIPFGQQILQQSAPLTLAGYFLREQNYDIFAALDYNSREYTKYKSKLLNAVTQINIQPGQTVSSILDKAISYITNSLTNASPFYWSDMFPTGTNYTSTVTTINPITGKTFNTLQTYNFTSSNYLGLLVYVNDVLLLRNSQYVVSTDTPKITITIPLNVGDVVTINEYPTTVGNWCPNTPSKMGLYPKYKPEIYLDETYSEPTVVIQGHDGSTTIAYGDIRDQILFEFEKRIYDNIKVDDNPIPLSTDRVDPLFYPAQTTALLPGFFRKTPYTYAEVNSIMSEEFLSWVGQNKLNYTEQNYVSSNPFTYNYSQSSNRLDQAAFLQGNWRGLYRYFYDTETPNTTPWEMMGFSEMPAWWEQRYGPAPYTAGNTVLWDDLEAGIVGDPAGPYLLPEYIRPGLSKIIPSGPEGELLNPLDTVVGLTNPLSYQQSWVAGDGGPVQASWWNSSSYPFAMMRMLAVTKPAQFFSVFADRDLYRYDTTLGQYLYNGRYRLDAAGLQIYGNGTPKASYINWIVDYNRQTGVNSTTALTADLANLDVRLCYRMASFSDPVYVKLFTERAGPGSSNNSLEIPAASYDLLFYKNQPFGSITYSAVVIEVVQLENGNTGYTVYGYSNVQPYFDILVSSPVGLYTKITSGGTTVQVPSQYTTDIAQVPYGYTFTSMSSVCDFLMSYGAYLESQGLTFEDTYNNYVLSWTQMSREFLYFATQGWTNGTILNLNPSATKITATRPISIVDTIASVTPENMLLDQNRNAIDVSTLIVNRDNNLFSVSSTTGQHINYLTLKFTNYEDMIVLNNTSQYNDLIYDPVTAARQSRLSLIASTTTEWNGQLNAQGFVINLNNVQQWQANTRYTKGQMVLYKNTYWQALVISEPQAKFNYADWVKTDYEAIDTGLLPNLANKANQLVSAYDVYEANLTSDNNLFAFGLIGFRPRQYMTDMNLNSVTQVQLYQQFLGTKGTINAAEIFSRASLGKESGQYNVYENWGVLAGTYGAQANKSYFEIQLNEALLSYNPSTIQIVQPGEVSQANQQVYVSKLWRESYNITSTEVLPTIYENIGYSTALPSAGYVCLDDVDVTVFDIDDPSAIYADIDNIGIGTYIWIAKVNSYDWGVYRTAEVNARLTTVISNLDDTSTAQFSDVHSLSVGDLIIIRYFNNSVNGVYRVLTVPTPTTITIGYTFTKTSVTSMTGTGLVFNLVSARVAQASDIATLSYVNTLTPGAKVWIDKNVDGHWETVQKESPFTIGQLLNSNSQATDVLGASVSQTTDVQGALVGSPGINTVYGYYVNSQSQYAVGQALTLTATNTSSFGNAVFFGNNNWAIAGANTSLNGMGYAAIIYRESGTGDYSITQLLLPPDQNFTAIGFGSSATMSFDERWMYIGAPGNNTVYAYTRVDMENQTVSYVTDGVTKQFNYANTIQINYNLPQQLTVTIGGYVLTNGVDYNINQTSVIFEVAPPGNQELIITRNLTKQLDQQYYYGIQQTFTTGTGFGASFTVDNIRGEYVVTLTSGGQGYSVGDTLTVDGAQIGGLTTTNNLVITVTVAVSGAITGFTTSGNGNYSIISYNLNTWLYNATSVNNFTVTVDDQIQRPYYDFIFDEATTQLTFISSPLPGLGAVIEVATPTYWQYTSSITSPTSLSGDAFGSAVSTTTDGRQIIIGAPNATVASLGQAGTVYVYDRSVIRYIVSNPAQTTYAILGAVTNPVSVIVNNAFLTNTTQSLSGQYTVSGSNIVFSNITLNYGDVIEIGTNQIQQIQQISSDFPTYEATYGSALASCPINCSIYIGSPRDSRYIPQSGSVEHLTNQSRVYGVTTSTNANPTLLGGGTIRINDTQVAVPASPNNTIRGLVDAINAANIPNVIAVTVPDAVFVGDGSTTIYNIGTLYTSANTYNTVVYINDVLQYVGVDYSYDPSTQNVYFIVPPAPSSIVTVVSGRITLSVKNSASVPASTKITVLPGVIDSVFGQLGFNTFVLAQQILSPLPVAMGLFGSSINVDTSAINLIIGSPNGNVYQPTTFDAGKTYFDDYSTTISNTVNNGGVAYTYDYFASSSPSVSNPGQFAFGQQIYSDSIQQGSQFGIAVNYTGGKLLVGSPGTNGVGVTGFAAVFNNLTNSPAWNPIRIQQPVVDVYSIDGVFTYNGGQAIGVNNTIDGGTQTYFDFIDPLQGKILGVARQNIDYIGAVDPAQYNTGSVHNNGSKWGAEHIGEMWWDTDTIRFIDPNQDDILYSSRRWGTTFPGSTADVYQWIESTNPPTSYRGTGTPLSITSYTVGSALGPDNVFTTTYYFWVRGVTSISEGAGKTLSASGVASYILNPRSSGLPYIAGLNASTIAIYNAQGLLSGTNTILSIGFDRKLNDAVIHQEYQIITDGIANSFLNTQLYRKFQDSLCGIDTIGNTVPDPTLSPGMRYGVEFRPRQSMFANRFAALENYLVRANTILAQYPISETRSFDLLNASEPTPTVSSGAWNFEVPNLEVLGYQNLKVVPAGYKYLVLSDSTQQGRWTIYEVGANQTLSLIQIQNYDTSLYWYYINWYSPGYNSSTAPIAAVQNYGQLSTLSYTTAPIGSSVRVINNGANKWEIYLRTGADPLTDWSRVGLEDGTIAFNEELWNYNVGNFGFDSQVFDSQYFDETPQTETRYIIRALNEQIYIEDLEIEKNSSLVLMFNYVYSEFTNPAWLVKTSYVDVNHDIRVLEPYQTYLQDNQDFVLNYFNEVKPYHVQVRQFNLIYTGQDDFQGDITDYDLPAKWNNTVEVPQFISPILTPYDIAVTPNYSLASDTAPDAQLWLAPSSYSQWYNNYLLSVISVTVAVGGSGYTITPVVTVSGNCVTPAVMTAVINSVGQVIAINVVSPGVGYSSSAIVTITGGNGTGAIAVAQMGNPLVRSINTTIKYDRYQYQTTIVPWVAGVTYSQGTEVRYNNKVWQANATVTNTVFDLTQWTVVEASTLSGVNRTMGYYIGTASTPGLSLPLLVDGIDYPGVQVHGLNFDQDTGFARGAFDMTPFDNISVDATGQPTYDIALLDTIFESSYLDIYLGTRATDINIDGGAYVDTYESHAPEELVPGIVYDTLDMRIYTTPGADWQGLGHGFPQALTRVTYDVANPTYSFAGLMPYPITVELSDETQGYNLSPGIDYTVDWTQQTVTILNTSVLVADGDQLGIYVYELGGGNQLYKQVYNGADVGNSLVVPMEYNLIWEFAIFVNGVQTTQYTFADNSDVTFGTTLITFTNTYTSTDFISLVILGPTTIDGVTTNYGWSIPLTQVIPAVTGTSTYSLTNSLLYTNPVNAIITLGGRRIRSAAGIRYTGNGTTTIFAVAQRLGFDQAIIAPTDVTVYFNDVLQPSTEYIVLALTSGTTVSFVTAPDDGVNIYIAVSTNAQAIIDPTAETVTFSGVTPFDGELIEVTTFNDTREQRLLTQVFVGPVVTGVTVSEGYDTTEFDQGNISYEPGAYDYTEGDTVTSNDLELGQLITDSSRPWVSLNGKMLAPDVDYTIEGTQLILGSGILQTTDVVMVTLTTNSVVPEAMEFRVFQDMRGVQATYRMTAATTTTLVEPVTISDDIIYVANASALTEPDFAANIWGVITIDGERIMYRNRDVVANTVSSLLRGTAGTGADEHTVGTEVYDMGRGNLLSEDYQNYIDSNYYTSNGIQTIYTTDINVNLGNDWTGAESFNDTSYDQGDVTGDPLSFDYGFGSNTAAVQVYVGGILQTDGYAIITTGPLVVVFNTAPAEGLGITIMVSFGVTWYAPGGGNPSNGAPLQETTTPAALFLQGKQS